MVRDKILTALQMSWCSESSSKYEKENPAKGQCSVTAIVVCRIFGGEILRTEVGGCYHFYNRIDGEVVDFTAAQFNERIEYHDASSSVEEALKDCSELQVGVLTSQFLLHYRE